jgi:hypothetical protein
VPDNRTTGTTALPRRHRSGRNFISAALILGNLRYVTASVLPMPFVKLQ